MVIGTVMERTSDGLMLIQNYAHNVTVVIKLLKTVNILVSTKSLDWTPVP